MSSLALTNVTPDQPDGYRTSSVVAIEGLWVGFQVICGRSSITLKAPPPGSDGSLTLPASSGTAAWLVCAVPSSTVRRNPDHCGTFNGTFLDIAVPACLLWNYVILNKSLLPPTEPPPPPPCRWMLGIYMSAGATRPVCHACYLGVEGCESDMVERNMLF